MSILEQFEQKNLFGETFNSAPLINREALTVLLTEEIKKLSLEEFVGLMTNKYSEIIEYAELIRGGRSCQKTSLLFTPHRLNCKAKESKHSIFEAVKADNGFLSGLARATIFKYGKVNELLYQVLQLGINGIQYINEFPPHVARDLCLKYGLTRSSRVLDPCAGWGGRMIGVSVVSNYYEGFDTSEKTCLGLVELEKFLKFFNGRFKAVIHPEPFEDSEISPESFDFAVTSPPYFDTEIYSESELDSANRFKDFGQWSSGFYLPLIRKTMRALRSGSVFILNIGSRKYPLSELLKREFSGAYEIRELGNLLSGKSGLGRTGEGENFFEIKKG